MRYDSEIFFIKETTTHNDNTGNYDIVELITDKRYANVSNQTDEHMKLAYGTITQGGLTIRLQNHYDAPFDYITRGGVIYGVDSQRLLRKYHILHVSAL